jgi:hypothetical protein
MPFSSCRITRVEGRTFEIRPAEDLAEMIREVSDGAQPNRALSRESKTICPKAVGLFVAPLE